MAQEPAFILRARLPGSWAPSSKPGNYRTNSMGSTKRIAKSWIQLCDRFLHRCLLWVPVCVHAWGLTVRSSCNRQRRRCSLQPNHGYHFSNYCDVRQYRNFYSDIRLCCALRCHGNCFCFFPIRAVRKEELLREQVWLWRSEQMTPVIFNFLDISTNLDVARSTWVMQCDKLMVRIFQVFCTQLHRLDWKIEDFRVPSRNKICFGKETSTLNWKSLSSNPWHVTASRKTWYRW